jgi:UrcA family protein
MKGFIVAAVALTGTLAASWAAALPVSASDADIGLGSVTVRFERQELASSAGIEGVYLRLRQAAQEVCSPYESIALERRRAFARCVKLSLARAVADVRDAALTAYSEHRSPDVSVARAR